MGQIRFTVQAYMYPSVETCANDNNHLTSCDADGYCLLCGYMENKDEIMKDDSKNFMMMALETDLQTYTNSIGEINLTTLAENTALNFDHEEWLSDDTHWVWDLAIEVTEEYNK